MVPFLCVGTLILFVIIHSKCHPFVIIMQLEFKLQHESVVCNMPCFRGLLVIVIGGECTVFINTLICNAIEKSAGGIRYLIDCETISCRRSVAI